MSGHRSAFQVFRDVRSGGPFHRRSITMGDVSARMTIAVQPTKAAPPSTCFRLHGVAARVARLTGGGSSERFPDALGHAL
jgi:hypothetical protein